MNMIDQLKTKRLEGYEFLIESMNVSIYRRPKVRMPSKILFTVLPDGCRARSYLLGESVGIISRTIRQTLFSLHSFRECEWDISGIKG